MENRWFILTTERPHKTQVVIDAISKYYQEINANIHRGVHTLSQLATDAKRNLARKFKTTSMPNLLMVLFTSKPHTE
jgi:cysteine desulfurase/selenocysteine lyase